MPKAKNRGGSNKAKERSNLKTTNSLGSLKSKKELLESLKRRLTPLYTQPQATGAHDLPHVVRVAEMYPEIRDLAPGVDETVYQITAWLHNVDRCPAYHELISSAGLTSTLFSFLGDSELTSSENARIVQAVFAHGKKDDEPGDSMLLKALRIADKWSRFDVIGITSGIAWKGNELPLYRVENPFVYGPTAEGEWKTHYGNFFRVLEWYAMSADIRELVRRRPEGFREMLFFVRAWARAVSAAHRVANTVEEDLVKCLGPYYGLWKP